MPVEHFRQICSKIRPYTNYIYLHVLGEPLLHPHFDDILSVAEEAGLNINLTTNAALLARKEAILQKYRLRQINFSLHDAEENIAPDKWADYLLSVLKFADKAADKTYCCLRLWNSGSVSSEEFSLKCVETIANHYGLNTATLLDDTAGNGIKLADRIFLQRSPRFEWPDERREVAAVNSRYCYALRDHIAILAGGEIVPCCLDADAKMQLGNIFTDDLGEVLRSSRAQNIKNGFAQRRIVEPLCATCGFVVD